VVGAERPEPGQHRVDLGLSGDERRQRIFVWSDDLLSMPRAHLQYPDLIVSSMSASSA
jgi:hypothetical protein